MVGQQKIASVMRKTSDLLRADVEEHLLGS
jgi:hypothetical protein